MERIELKHLACYLPYGLKVFNPYDKRAHTYDTEETIEVLLYKSGPFKPLVIPLSQLTKEDFKAMGWVNEPYVGTMVDWALITIPAKTCDINSWLWLIEHHFDVFDLIGKGLGLNKNEYLK